MEKYDSFLDAVATINAKMGHIFDGNDYERDVHLASAMGLRTGKTDLYKAMVTFKYEKLAARWMQENLESHAPGSVLISDIVREIDQNHPGIILPDEKRKTQSVDLWLKEIGVYVHKGRAYRIRFKKR